MNWKNEAIERLKRYEPMKAAAHNMIDELKELSSKIASLKSSMAEHIAVKTSAEFNDQLLNDITRKEEMSTTLLQTKTWLKSTEKALGLLSPEEKLVLYRLYISRERNAIDRLCTELGCEQSTVYRKRDAALKRFTTALYGYLET